MSVDANATVFVNTTDRRLEDLTDEEGGRPRTALVSEACRQVLAELVPKDPEGRTYAQVIAAVLAKKAIRGDRGAAVELADRAEGRPRMSVDANATVFVNTTDRRLEDLTDEELAARRAKLLEVIEGNKKGAETPALPPQELEKQAPN